MSSTRPTTIGGSITVSDSQSLANLSVAGLPPGTTVWNEDVGAFFKLTTCARRDIVLDPTDFYDTGVFTFANGDFTAADEGQTLVVRFDYPNTGYNANYLIDSVDSATEITVDPAPADASVEPFTGAVTVVDTGPSEADVVVSVQAGAVFGVVWRIVGVVPDDSITNAMLAEQPAHTVVGNATAGVANPTYLTRTQLTAELNEATNALPGAMPAANRAVLWRTGTTLTDASATIQPFTDNRSQYVLPSGTLSTNRVLTMGIAGAPAAAPGTSVLITILDTSANTYTINNNAGTPQFVKVASGSPQTVLMYFTAGDWALSQHWYTGA